MDYQQVFYGVPRMFFGVQRGAPATVEGATIAYKYGGRAQADCDRLGVGPCEGCTKRCLAYPGRSLDCPFLSGPDD